MAEANHVPRSNKLSKPQMAASVIFVLLVLLVIWLIAAKPFKQTTPGNSSSANPITQSDSNNPDPVKTQNGSNGDTSPSPSGTGQDGNNSLLSQ